MHTDDLANINTNLDRLRDFLRRYESRATLTNLADSASGKTYQAQPFPPFIQNIITKGGLMASIREGK